MYTKFNKVTQAFSLGAIVSVLTGFEWFDDVEAAIGSFDLIYHLVPPSIAVRNELNDEGARKIAVKILKLQLPGPAVEIAEKFSQETTAEVFFAVMRYWIGDSFEVEGLEK
jgi:hypothetical protein